MVGNLPDFFMGKTSPQGQDKSDINLVKLTLLGLEVLLNDTY